jgi:ABC-2 type transport system ATP-binding protein
VTAAVTVTALTKRYGDRTALDEVTLSVRQGTVHGLLGPNGAGKTTLLRVLLGLVRPDGGSAEIAGTAGGFVETPGAYPYLTGRRNLELLASLDDAPGDVTEVLDRVDLTDRADTKVAGWSLGMRQRLGIAAGLLRAPDVLVLDEPSNGLDPAGAKSLRSLVRGLADDGLTVLLCSHDLHEVEVLADDVTVLVSGTVRWHGGVSELRARPGAHLLSTSDDRRALALAEGVDAASTDGGFTVVATTEQLDAYVISLAQQGIAIRELVRESMPLERAFLELTA